MAITGKKVSVPILFSFALVTFLFALFSAPIISSKSQNQTDRDEQKKMTEAIRRGGGELVGVVVVDAAHR